jgi:spore maturation protein CgeB
MKVLLVGDFLTWPSCLGVSYRNGFTALGCRVELFDVPSCLRKHTRFGAIGRAVSRYQPVAPWLLKVNRELVTTCRALDPEVVVVVGCREINAGAVAQIKASTRSRVAFVWMDPLQNLSEATIQALPVYDLIASYSRAAVEPLIRLGARRVEWVPFAGDLALYGAPPAAAPPEFQSEVSFIGNWRPEREAVLDRLASVPGLGLKIWGEGGWRRHSRSRLVAGAWQRRSVYTEQFVAAARASKVNLNIIESTNYPGANMRFFELPCAGGLQLSSPCPEMAEEFRDGETIFYFRDAEELPGLIRKLLDDDARRERVAAAAHEKILAAHTYAHRARQILEVVS